MNRIIAKIESRMFSTREYFFIGVILFLYGLVIGLFASPKGERNVGCNNGNNSGNNNSDCMTDEVNGISDER